MSEVKAPRKQPVGPQWVKPWFNTWLRGLRTYCDVMGEPVPSTFRQAFKMYPPPAPQPLKDN